jgi:hypothetical protein
MAPSILGSLNKTILVAIPALFGNTEARRCTLIAIEPFGLWLVSGDLIRALQPDAKHQKPNETEAAPAIFIPFGQIVALLPVAIALPPAGVGLKPAKPASPPSGSSQYKPSKPSHPRKAGS